MHMGRDPDEYFGIVNPPIIRTSTVLAQTFDELEDFSRPFPYGNMNTPIRKKFEEAMAEIEGGYNAIATATGLAAINLALLSFVKPGDHILIPDHTYPTTRTICDQFYKRMDIEAEYYDPMVGGDIAKICKDNTSIIFLESPGSFTYEVQDVPAIAEVAKAKNILTIIDNTYAAGVLYKPLSQGVDVSLQAATKYIGGHSDVNLGVVVASTEELFKQIQSTGWNLGMAPASEDIFLALRGLRTMKLRLRQHEENTLRVMNFLTTRPEVTKVFHPALESNPGHKIWKRDFTGSNGLVSFGFKGCGKQGLRTFMDALELFPMGASWGGYESLARHQYMKTCRTATWDDDCDIVVRLHVGLEDPEDLIADLEQAFEKFAAVMES